MYLQSLIESCLYFWIGIVVSKPSDNIIDGDTPEFTIHSKFPLYQNMHTMYMYALYTDKNEHNFPAGAATAPLQICQIN